MDGPRAHILDNRAAIEAALRAADLTPEVHLGDARRMAAVADGSVHLVATSPPYPMIEMWDAQFAEATGLAPEDPGFYEACHRVLDAVWAECHRALAPGGILAVNVGDATRTVNGRFQLFQNHVRIATALEALGLTPLIPILWKKPTNKPNAFLGSGFIPPNGYVTLDCEHILLFRKGDPRKLPPRDTLRYASEFSKAERDAWFTQVWEVPGARQEGMATFPDEVPERLIRMFSVLGDVVLDPFAGTGQTLKAARRLGRKAIGYEVNASLEKALHENVPAGAPDAGAVVDALLARYPPP